MSDFRAMSSGGVLIDGTGDLALTLSPWEEISTMISTRLKASLNAYQLYSIGADLESLVGQAPPQELEIAVQQQATQCLTGDLLPAGCFTVSTLVQGSEITIFVYVQNTLVNTTTLAL